MTKTVLIVDDDESICELLSLKFGKLEGVEVHTVNSGHEGMTLATSLKPDLIILDIMMPDIDGDQVYRTLKDDADNLDQTSVIFLSSLIEPSSDEEPTINKFGYWMLSKSLSPDKIVQQAMSLIS